MDNLGLILKQNIRRNLCTIGLKGSYTNSIKLGPTNICIYTPPHCLDNGEGYSRPREKISVVDSSSRFFHWAI